MTTRNRVNPAADELRPEYELSTLTGRTAGKYHAQATAGTTLVLLEPDVADAFPDGPAVNRALRVFLKMQRAKLPGKRLPPATARRLPKKRAGRRG
jgi:hypothetical protein